MDSDNEIIILGGGCFWCTEAVFKMFDGIESIDVGYAGGNTKDPTYQEVCRGNTGHIEVAMIKFNPNKIKLEKILDIFFKMHDPTSKDRMLTQAHNIGLQYSILIRNKNQ